ncbi:hypothetical protein, partial [Salmonella enterica]|uniref:hypothetical protein n=1 Tax=Salmonella enterica TaxID=28901 RepID=UPI0032990DAA
GASAGLAAGFAVWAYTMLLPSLAGSECVWHDLVRDGPFGLAALRPTALLGIDLPPLTHGVVWSLAVNVAAYIGFSLLRP